MPGAVNLPLKTVLDGSALGSIPKDKPLLMVCRSGARSMRAANYLAEQGYTDLTNITGGTAGYYAKGLKTSHF